MKDIEIAQKILLEKNKTLVIVKNKEVIFSSEEKGIKPMYNAVKQLESKLAGASLADRVIGKAAAMLAVYANIKEMHTVLISKGGKVVLDESKIIYTYEKCVPYIKNRSKNDLCPIEKISQSISNTVDLINEIEIFLGELED